MIIITTKNAKKYPEMTMNMLKQAPYAVADLIAIFPSSTKERGPVFVLELRTPIEGP